MRYRTCLSASLALGLATAGVLAAGEHYDLSPYLVSGQLLVGGLDHDGNAVPPPVSVFGYEFGEEPLDPYNPADPGVNQQAGTGNLPAGAALRYNILGSLIYWDGVTEASWGLPPGATYLNLTMGTTTRTLTGTSGPQAGSLIQSVASNGSVHKHFVSSLFAAPGSSNVPGDIGFVDPVDGIYAFQIELTLTPIGGSTLVSDPVWIVFNNGLTEEQHEEAMESLIPEPASLSLLGLPALLMLRRRR
jgi:hypothetical protein